MIEFVGNRGGQPSHGRDAGGMGKFVAVLLAQFDGLLPLGNVGLDTDKVSELPKLVAHG